MIDTDRINASKIPKWKYDEIEQKVVNLYIEQNIRKFPVDPFEIIKNRGYILIPFSKLGDVVRPESEYDENDAFSFFSPDDNTYIIAYDDGKPLLRLRFTLMHEIGHIDLGHKGESDLAKRMADYYAGYALAPSPLISKFASNDVDHIRSVFWVSKYCAEVCCTRYMNWVLYGEEDLKDYEVILLGLFK